MARVFPLTIVEFSVLQRRDLPLNPVRLVFKWIVTIAPDCRREDRGKPEEPGLHFSAWAERPDGVSAHSNLRSYPPKVENYIARHCALCSGTPDKKNTGKQQLAQKSVTYRSPRSSLAAVLPSAGV
jgi:hypothetical protein